jgi:hypothetical protein
VEAFLIESGDYSDYRVHAVVVGSQADAQALADRWNAVPTTTGSVFDLYCVSPTETYTGKQARLTADPPPR